MTRGLHSDDRDMIVNRNPGGMNGGDDGRLPPGVKNGNNDRIKGAVQPFMPGQQGSLARQLSNGFGGTQKAWNNRFGQMYSPMQVPQPFHYSTVGGDAQSDNNGDNPNKPGDVKNPDPGVFDDPFGRSAQMMGQQARPPMQQAQMQSQMQPQAQAQGQQMSPEMLAMLRQYMMQRGV